MAIINSLVHLDMNKQQLLNACLQNLSVHPVTTSLPLAYIYYNTSDKTVYCWTGLTGSGGAGWLDLGYLNGTYTAINETFTGAEIVANLTTDSSGNVTNLTKRLLLPSDLGIAAGANNYIHPTGFTYDSGSLTGMTIISKVKVNAEGHVIDVQTRNLTLADLGAAAAVHTHTTSQITDITSTATEINAATDLSGVSGASAGWTYRFTSPTTATWGKLKGSEIVNDMLWVTIDDSTLSTTTTYSSSQIEALFTQLNGNIANAVVGSLINQGGFTPTTSSSTPTPTTAASIKNGMLWVFTGVNGFMWNGSEVESGDMLIANQNLASPTNPAHWTVVNKNIPAIVDATSLIKGIVRLATNAEAQAKTSSTIALTPANLATITASESYAGLIRLATNTETNLGVLNSVAVSPQNLKLFYDVNIKGYTALFGDGSTLSFDIVHNLNSVVNVQILDEISGDVVWVQIKRLNANSVRLIMNIAPSTNQYRVIITK